MRRVAVAVEPQTEAIALPVEDLHLAASAVEKHEQHRVEDFHFDVQLDQCRQAVDGFTEVDGLGMNIRTLSSVPTCSKYSSSNASDLTFPWRSNN